MILFLPTVKKYLHLSIILKYRSVYIRA